ncbi:MAG: response regulator, partial [Deltaproteobacteria bacterium]
MSPPRILVIEDDSTIRRLIEVTLSRRGDEVHCAEDGVAGLEVAERVQPDVIVLDVNMPRMDGWEVLKRLRASESFAFTPVILLTALASPDHRVEGFKLGADDYMTKPFRAAELEMRVVRALKQRAQLVYFSQGLARARAAKPGTLRGSLAEFPPAGVLSLLYDGRKTGTVVFTSDVSKVRVSVREGFLVSFEVDAVRVECARGA